MNNNSNIPLMELYQTYASLQSYYKEHYADLEEQFNYCKCINCKLKLITFGLELVSINASVAHLESQLTPEIDEVLTCMNIGFVVAPDGQTRLLHNT